MKKNILFFLSFLLLACTKDIEIEIPKEEPKLVVYSTIVPFTLPQPKNLGVSLQSSLHIGYDSVALIDDATVLYFENGEFKDTLKQSETGGNYLISNEISDYPIAGNTYSIEVTKEGYNTVTATTQIPSLVTITDVTVEPISYFDDEGFVVSEIAVTFTDPADEVNYYELCVSDIAFDYDSSSRFKELTTHDNIITSESYYPSLIRFDLKKPKYLLFSDKTINGQEYTLRVYYSPRRATTEDGTGTPLIGAHYISVHLRNVTHDYYKFKTSMIQHLYNKTEDLLYGMGEPLNVISNINNGYGLFAGFNNDIVSIHIPQQIIN